MLLLVDGDDPQQHVEQQVGEVFGEALQHVGLLRVGLPDLMEGPRSDGAAPRARRVGYGLIQSSSALPAEKLRFPAVMLFQAGCFFQANAPRRASRLYRITPALSATLKLTVSPLARASSSAPSRTG